MALVSEESSHRSIDSLEIVKGERAHTPHESIPIRRPNLKAECDRTDEKPVRPAGFDRRTSGKAFRTETGTQGNDDHEWRLLSNKLILENHGRPNTGLLATIDARQIHHPNFPASHKPSFAASISEASSHCANSARKAGASAAKCHRKASLKILSRLSPTSSAISWANWATSSGTSSVILMPLFYANRNSVKAKAYVASSRYRVSTFGANGVRTSPPSDAHTNPEKPPNDGTSAW